jgi:hypothetical protein
MGIPTDVPRDGEEYLAEYKIYHSGFAESLYGVEWMRYGSDSPVHELVKRVPHVAFEVDDLARALEDREVLIEPNSPSEGVVVAFVVCDGAPVEFLQFTQR